jgi:DNA-binding LytR/AlgR family response regulator
MKLKCLIVEDDVLSSKALEHLCLGHEHLDLSGICEDAESALNHLRRQSVDLIILDVEMPGLNGIEFLKQLAHLPQVIMVTGKKEYAYEAFEYQVTDFLAKPVNPLRFRQAIDRAVQFHTRLFNYHKHPNDVFIRSEGRLLRLPLNDILYFENVSDYVRIKTTGQTYLIHSTLKNIEAKLNDPRFLKVHRSFIVNLEKIKDIEENNLVIGQTIIPISRAHKPVLLSRINII